MKKTILYIFLGLVTFLYGQTQLNWNTQLRNRPNITRVGSVSTWTDTVNFNNDSLFKSGRPWFDVMAFGAKNDGATDDTAAIQSAITAACTAGGGIIYFPPSTTAAKYYRVTLSGSTSPFIASCDNLTFTSGNGISFSGSSNLPAQIFAPNLNAPIFTTSGGQRFGLIFYGLQLTGAGAAQSGSQGINIVNAGSVIISNMYFGQFGSSCLVAQAGTGLYLYNNSGINCLKSLPSVDTGTVDISSSDTVANGNFFSASIPDMAGNLGTGHAYAWRINSANGAYIANMGELSHHGWLFTSSASHNRVIGSRGFLNQGSCIVNAGVGNNFSDIECLTNGQNANGTIDAILVTAGNGVYSNIICNTVGGDGNANRHCISDSNSTSLLQQGENQYSNNRADTTAITGVLYNMTGTSPYLIMHPHKISPDRGDSNVTIQCGVDAETQYFNTGLTTNRTVTFSNTGAWNGCHFRIVRTVSASGAQALVTNAATGGNIAPGQTEDYEFNGTWQAVGMGIISLPGSPNSVLLFGTDGRPAYAALASSSPTATIASGTATMTTALIGAGACGTTVTVGATNTATTDTITWAFNAVPAANPAQLVVSQWPTAGNVNFQYCNPTAGGITPNAATLNWRVVR